MVISQDNTPRKRPTRWLHTRAFALPAYLLALLVGYYTGILGHLFAPELFANHRIDYNELMMMPINAGLMFVIASMDILPRLALGSILMVPATMALLALARRLNMENPYFAAPSGVIVAAIFALILELSSGSRGGGGAFGADTTELAGSVLLGGVCAGLTYWGYLKLSGLLTKISGASS